MKKKNLNTFAIILAMLLMLTACGGKSETETSVSGKTFEITEEEISEAIETEVEEVESTGESTPAEESEETENIKKPENTKKAEENEESAEEPTEESVKPAKSTEKSETSAHTHTWTEATCASPKTCSGCGKTSGSALGHNFSNGKCTRCGAKDSDYTEPTTVHTHTWTPATCTLPKTCTTCGATEGSALGHDFSDERVEDHYNPDKVIVGCKCSDCGQVFAGDDIKAHQNETFYMSSYKCNDCNYDHPSMNLLTSHQEQNGHSGWTEIQVPTHHSGWSGVEIDDGWEKIHRWFCSRCGVEK